MNAWCGACRISRNVHNIQVELQAGVCNQNVQPPIRRSVQQKGRQRSSVQLSHRAEHSPETKLAQRRLWLAKTSARQHAAQPKLPTSSMPPGPCGWAETEKLERSVEMG